MSDDVVNVEVDGRPLKARKGQMVIQLTDQAGVYVPRFCYHEKLTIAANCRMCLVEVEKAPKPMPACATPVTEGMKVFTRSPRALAAQKATMEFLLINHPLDCPICDQGGECELQDLALGFGSAQSRFDERKRVVKDKNLGPLISTDMTRCIHCTRCVRFTAEIAGMQELGATGRGEDMEIGTFIEKSVDHELSGNVIDLCPVGALNSKPFRHRARSWEMTEHALVSPHDGAGTNLWGHVLRGRLMRVVPRDQRGDQRDLDRGPRPLLVRRHLRAGPAARADDAHGRPLAGGVVGGRARGGGDDAAGRGQGRRRRARSVSSRRRAPRAKRATCSARLARGLGIAQRRFAAAPARFLGPGERSGVSGARPGAARHRRPRGPPARGLRRADRGADRRASRAHGGARRLQGERRLDDGAGISVPGAAADGRAACGPRGGACRARGRLVERCTQGGRRVAFGRARRDRARRRCDAPHAFRGHPRRGRGARRKDRRIARLPAGGRQCRRSRACWRPAASPAGRKGGFQARTGRRPHARIAARRLRAAGRHRAREGHRRIRAPSRRWPPAGASSRSRRMPIRPS